MAEYDRHRMASWISLGQEYSPGQQRHSRIQVNPRRNFQRTFQTEFPARAGKRRQENEEEIQWSEPHLITLCRENRWFDVIQRCHLYPEEAVPQPVTKAFNKYDLHAVKRVINSDLQIDATAEPVFQETALGIACASAEIDTKQLETVIQTLIQASGRQLCASQLIPGHTPLRDALKNPRLTPRILKILTGSLELATKECSDFQSAILKPDRNGLLPLDHLIVAVQLGSHPYSLPLLEEFIKSSDIKDRGSIRWTSPLIRLLSLGTSFGISDAGFVPSLSHKSDEGGTRRLSGILEATKYLLEKEPSLIDQCSRITGCSPLHVALRNYGDYTPLIQELIFRDPSNNMLAQRNHYGDLPLHVASSVGVPMRVLKIILEHTLAVTGLDQNACSSPHPLVWSVNNSGYTPIDLEWVRHIESGMSFYNARSFYPLEPTGVRKHCFKQDEYYQDLLREAVDQLIQQPRKEIKEPMSIREDEAKHTFGALVDRIQLLVLSAANRSIPSDTSTLLLHNSCKLCGPYGPTLPLPLLKLVLWLYPEQLDQLDHSGNLPIHYLLRQSQSECKPSKVENWADWEFFVSKLLAEAPQTTKVADADSRLPLHLLLDSRKKLSQTCDSSLVIEKLALKLVKLYPECVDVRDPVTMLYPFMLAATDSSNPVDLILLLLLRSPSRCFMHSAKKTVRA